MIRGYTIRRTSGGIHVIITKKNCRVIFVGTEHECLSERERLVSHDELLAEKGNYIPWRLR